MACTWANDGLLWWWRHQREAFSALLAICAGNSPVTSDVELCCLICAWINAWVNTREAGDLRRHRVHYDVIVMLTGFLRTNFREIWIKLQRLPGMKMDRNIAHTKWPPFCSGLCLKTNGSRETACVGHQLIMQIYIYIQVQHNRLREL